MNFAADLRSILDALPVVVALADKDSRYRYVNHRYLELIGLPLDQVIGHTAKEVLGESYEIVRHQHERVLSGQSFDWCGTGSVRGRTRHMEFHYVPLLDQDGAVESYALFGWDVTERVEAERSLAASEARFRQLASVGFEAVFLLRDDLCFEVNEAVTRLFGYTRAECIGRHRMEFIASESRPRFRSQMADNKAGPFETVALRKDGTVFPVEVQSRDLALYGVQVRVTALRDITRRKERENALRRSEERLASLWKVARMTEAGHDELCELVVDESQRLTRSQAAFFGFVSPDGRTLEIKGRWSEKTRSGCMLSGKISHVDVEGGGLWTLPIKEKRPLVVNDYSSWTMGKKGYPKGHAPLVRLMVVPVLDQGRVTALAGVANKVDDYTKEDVRQVETFVANVMTLLDRRRVLEELRLALERAEAGSRSKGEFLATMSHEVRTPLNGMMGMLQLLEMTKLDDEQQDFVRTALSSGRSLMRILSDILDFSRIEAGSLELADEPFELSDVVQPVLDIFREQAQAKKLVLECEVDPSLPPLLFGDAGRIRQVLINLVSNSIKYTEQGKISLELYRLPAIRPDGRIAVHVAVTDTGVGIPPDKLENIYEAFTQVDSSFTRRHGGAGLGLSIVRRLVKLMGGALSIISEFGQGTEAHLTLWLRPMDPETWRRPTVEHGLSPRVKATVLLVDDDRVGRLAAKGLLGKAGLTVLEAANGKEALEVLSRERVHLVLMDVQMPVMDGLEAVRRIRSGKDGVLDPGVPVLALTAHAMREDCDRFLRGGMDGTVTKPVEYQNLLAVLNRYLGGMRP